jgi:putative ABC transport system permease protein
VSVQRDLVATSRAHSGSGRGGRLLVGAEIALGVLILLAGGLVLESFRKVLGTDAGFDSRGVLSFRVTLPTARYPTAGDVRAGYDAIAAALLPLPGTRGAAYTWQLPMAGMQGSAGYTRATGEGAMALIHRVSPSYFETMGMRLVHGCGLDCDTDRPPIVVNESLARLQWSDRDPVGALVTVNGVESRITGIVNDVRHGSLETAPTPELYQHGFLRTMFVVVRSTRPAPDLVPAVRAAVRAIDPALALSDVRTLDDRMAATVARRRFTLVALASFAILAALLALVGTYGVTALIVARRRREVAIRLALGATAGGAVGWMVGRQMPVLAGGVLTGAAGALALGRVFEPFLYQTSPFEPAVYLMVTAMMAFAALLATVLPARRIAAVSPLEALQSE